jgi:hypothetical protein
MFSLLVVFLILSIGTQQSSQYFIEVLPNIEECFFERTVAGTRYSLIFEVLEGSLLDIDLKVRHFKSQICQVFQNLKNSIFARKITDPEGKLIHESDHESNGKYAFSTHMNGMYKYCFSNKMSTITSKMVMFSIEINEPVTVDANAKHENLTGKWRQPRLFQLNYF